MTSESSSVVKSDSDQISVNGEEDKKFASQAVAFVIGHGRNGFVSLCASVASLLKEQARLKQEIDLLQQEILLLKKNSSEENQSHEEPIRETCISMQNLNIQQSDSCAIQKESMQSASALIKIPKQVPYKKLNGCICNMCSANKNYPLLTVPVERGMKVIIRGELTGVIQYVGHVDSLDFPEVFVGIKFSEPIGNSDGSFHSKIYFSVPKNCGMFVPLHYVHCIVNNYTENS